MADQDTQVPVAAAPQPISKPVAKKPVVAAVRKPAPAKAKPVARKPAAKPTSAARVRSAPAAKDHIMTDKTNALFADLNDRTKGAMEKGSKMFEDVAAFNKGNIEAIVESSKIAAKNIETIGQDAADYAKKSFEGATATMKTLAATKSPTEFMKIQSDYARTAFDTMIAEGSRSTEKMLKMFGEFAQPISNRVSVAAEKMKIVA